MLAISLHETFEIGRGAARISFLYLADNDPRLPPIVPPTSAATTAIASPNTSLDGPFRVDVGDPFIVRAELVL